MEDIQGLMALGRKAPKPQLMAVYYARLTRIFTVSGSHLYNGYAWCASSAPPHSRMAVRLCGPVSSVSASPRWC